MRLTYVHRILILAAIGLGLILVVYGLYTFTRTRDPLRLLLSAAGALSAVGFGLYLRWFLRKQAATDRSHPPR